MTDHPMITDWIQAIGTIAAILVSTLIAILVPLWMNHLRVLSQRKALSRMAADAFICGYRAYRNAPWSEWERDGKSKLSVFEENIISLRVARDTLQAFDFHETRAPVAYRWYSMLITVLDGCIEMSRHRSTAPDSSEWQTWHFEFGHAVRKIHMVSCCLLADMGVPSAPYIPKANVRSTRHMMARPDPEYLVEVNAFVRNQEIG